MEGQGFSVRFWERRMAEAHASSASRLLGLDLGDGGRECPVVCRACLPGLNHLDNLFNLPVMLGFPRALILFSIPS